MTNVQKAQLESAREYCDAEDKSTAFMIEYMQDVTGLSFDEVIDYLTSEAERMEASDE
jgi:hypothetical protein